MSWLKVDELMRAQGLTVKVVAKRTGLSEQYIRRLRRTPPRRLKLTTVDRLMQAFQLTSLDDLISLEGIKKEFGR